MVRNPGRGLLAALLIATLGPALPAAAQAVPSEFDLVQLQRRFEATLGACDSAARLRDVDQPRYDRLLADVNQAERAGDEDAWEEAQSRFLEFSQVLGNRQRRVRETCAEAEDARKIYLAGLDARRRALERQLEDAVEPSRQIALRAQIDDIHNRYRELEQARTGLEVRLVMRPLVEIHPTDTPDGVRQKAAFLERKIAVADSALATLDEELERLESRLERARLRENFRAGTRRFDDITPPVASDPQREGAGGVDDPGGQTLEGRIQEIRNARQQLSHYRSEMVARLREFREFLRTIT